MLASLVERLVDTGAVASIGSPARDPHIRATDFLPNPDGVIEEDRVCMTLGMLNGLKLRGTADEDLARLIKFLELASFHAGFAVTSISS